MGVFPTTGPLDNFERANENPIAVNWSGPIRVGDAQMQLLSAQMKGSAVGDNSSYWDLQTFGPDAEAWITIVTKPATGDFIQLFLRTVDPGLGTMDGYSCLVNVAAGTDTVEFYRYDNGAFIGIGTNLPVEFDAGNAFGIQMIGSDLRAFRYDGAWAEVNSVVDTTYAAAGYIGVRAFENVSNLVVTNDFGGGTVGSTLEPQVSPQVWADVRVR
jgi:hypothetical protein